jgi:hypothetical protein
VSLTSNSRVNDRLASSASTLSAIDARLVRARVRVAKDCLAQLSTCSSYIACSRMLGAPGSVESSCTHSASWITALLPCRTSTSATCIGMFANAHPHDASQPRSTVRYRMAMHIHARDLIASRLLVHTPKAASSARNCETKSNTQSSRILSRRINTVKVCLLCFLAVAGSPGNLATPHRQGLTRQSPLRQHMHSVRIRLRLCHVQDSDSCGSRSPALNTGKMHFWMSEGIGVVDKWQ